MKENHFESFWIKHPYIIWKYIENTQKASIYMWWTLYHFYVALKIYFKNLLRNISDIQNELYFSDTRFWAGQNDNEDSCFNKMQLLPNGKTED